MVGGVRRIVVMIVVMGSVSLVTMRGIVAVAV